MYESESCGFLSLLLNIWQWRPPLINSDQCLSLSLTFFRNYQHSYVHFFFSINDSRFHTLNQQSHFLTAQSVIRIDYRFFDHVCVLKHFLNFSLMPNYIFPSFVYSNFNNSPLQALFEIISANIRMEIWKIQTTILTPEFTDYKKILNINWIFNHVSHL